MTKSSMFRVRIAQCPPSTPVLGGNYDLGRFQGRYPVRVIPDVMNDDYLPKGRYPENFVWVS